MDNFVIHDDVNDLRKDIKDYVKMDQVLDILNEVDLIKKNMSRFIKTEDCLTRM